MNNKKIDALITLLDDENSNIAGTAMAELLSHDNDKSMMDSVMAELQETSELGLRKKIHQMQAIQRTRRRRRRLSKRFQSKNTNLIQGLADLHMIWYDEFGVAGISTLWKDIVLKASKNKPVSPKRLANFMIKTGFSVCNDNVQDADLFSIGAVIEDRIGTDIILSAIAMEVGRTFGLQGTLIRTEDNGFALIISNLVKSKNQNKPFYGEVILPSENWKVVHPETVLPFEIWPNSKVLKYVTGMLFANSVCSEGPRYIQILGSCLAGRTERDSLADILPYPFGKK
jgi:transglutaminase superfamily protein